MHSPRQRWADTATGITKLLLVVAVVVSFGPMTLMLLLGIFIVPVQLHYLTTLESNEELIGPVLVLASVAAGVAGLLALINVLLWLLNSPLSFMRRRWTLVCITLGLLPTSVFAFAAVFSSDSQAESLIMLLPLACSICLIYLARSFLFGPRDGTVATTQ